MAQRPWSLSVVDDADRMRQVIHDASDSRSKLSMERLIVVDVEDGRGVGSRNGHLNLTLKEVRSTEWLRMQGKKERRARSSSLQQAAKNTSVCTILPGIVMFESTLFVLQRRSTSCHALPPIIPSTFHPS